MIDGYRNVDPRYQPHVARAHVLRAVAFIRQIRRVARFATHLWTLLACRRRRIAAERELQALDDHTLKDIGLSRSQIGSAVVERMPVACRAGRHEGRERTAA